MSILSRLTPVSRKQIIYSDLFKDMMMNPISRDLALRLDEDSVKEAMKNILLTDKGERLFQPELGGNIRAMLFDNITPALVRMLHEEVKLTLNSYEPRAELIDVVVNDEPDSNSIRITIVFYVKNKEEPVTVTFFLERTR